MNFYPRLFRYAVWIGIIADLVLGIPGIFAPNWTLSLVGMTTSPHDALWISLASTMLVFLAFVYMPGANDPYRYPVNAWLSVLARPPGVAFFFFLYPGLYPAFGLLDLSLTIIQLPLLLLTMFASRPKADDQAKALALANTWSSRPFEYDGSTFEEVKSVAFSGRYEGKLPYIFGLTPWAIVRLFNDSCRNLSDKSDYLPLFTKLIHSNGICYTGVWRIDQKSVYTGYFAYGAEGLCLARLSVAGLFLNRGLFPRAFGIGGKVFPTMNPNEKVKPGNFVTVDHLSGTWVRNIIDTQVTNFPTLGLDPAPNIVNRIIFRLMDTRPGYRQLHPISTLGVKPGDPVVTPDLMMLQVAEGTPRNNARDFRDELRLKNYPGHKIVYTINVKNFEEVGWTRIGSIEFTEDAISEGGDKRIQFWIPRDRPNS